MKIKSLATETRVADSVADLRETLFRLWYLLEEYQDTGAAVLKSDIAYLLRESRRKLSSIEKEVHKLWR